MHSRAAPWLRVVRRRRVASDGSENMQFVSQDAGAPVPQAPKTLAGTYLGEAIEAIRNAGSADALFDHAIRSAAPADRERFWVAVATKAAVERRVNYSRAAMLFAAFAAEAYVNEFVAGHF